MVCKKSNVLHTENRRLYDEPARLTISGAERDKDASEEELYKNIGKSPVQV